MRTIVELRNVSIKGKGQYRLKNIHLNIESQERIALLGKSGAGKTTLIQVLNGTLVPDCGEAKWKGLEIHRLSQRKRQSIGTLWQDLRLIEELTVIQNINSGSLGRHNLIWAIGNLLGFIDNEHGLNCLSAVGLSNEKIHSSIMELSGGQKQRVAIARLLNQKSELLLADEPISNLDPVLVDDILNLFLSSGRYYSIDVPETAIVSLHRPDLIHNFSRVIGLKEGQIVFDQSTKNISKEDLKSIYQ